MSTNQNNEKSHVRSSIRNEMDNQQLLHSKITQYSIQLLNLLVTSQIESLAMALKLKQRQVIFLVLFFL